MKNLIATWKNLDHNLYKAELCLLEFHSSMKILGYNLHWLSYAWIYLLCWFKLSEGILILYLSKFFRANMLGSGLTPVIYMHRCICSSEIDSGEVF